MLQPFFINIHLKSAIFFIKIHTEVIRIRFIVSYSMKNGERCSLNSFDFFLVFYQLLAKRLSSEINGAFKCGSFFLGKHIISFDQ